MLVFWERYNHNIVLNITDCGHIFDILVATVVFRQKKSFLDVWQGSEHGFGGLSFGVNFRTSISS